MIYNKDLDNTKKKQIILFAFKHITIKINLKKSLNTN